MKLLPVSLVVVALAAAPALAKPAVAVLGIEVTGDIDQEATKTARELTEGLRSRAKSSGGPFVLAPNSDRELIDEKVLKDCAGEAPPCMATIGQELNAQVLVYGKLERDGRGYVVRLKVLDVKKKSVVRREDVEVPPGSNGDEVRAIAKKAYVEITADAVDTGTLVIETNVSEGTLFIDDSARGEIAGGRVRVSLPGGRYRVAIEAEGYRRKEATIRVEEDETTTEELELVRLDGSKDAGPDVWKPVFGVALTVTLGLAGYSTYAWLKQGSLANGLPTDPDPLAPGELLYRDANCGDATLKMANMDFRDACGFNSRHKLTAYLAVGTGAVTVVAAYLAYIRPKRAEATARKQVVVAPMLSTDGGGATLRIDW